MKKKRKRHSYVSVCYLYVSVYMYVTRVCIRMYLCIRVLYIFCCVLVNIVNAAKSTCPQVDLYN